MQIPCSYITDLYTNEMALHRSPKWKQKKRTRDVKKVFFSSSLRHTPQTNLTKCLFEMEAQTETRRKRKVDEGMKKIFQLIVNKCPKIFVRNVIMFYSILAHGCNAAFQITQNSICWLNILNSILLIADRSTTVSGI